MHRQGGFTLVETLVALVVLAVGLLGLTRMSWVYVGANTFTQQYTAATSAAQDKMEQLRSYATADEGPSSSVFDFDYLVSTDTAFTSVIDPGTGATIVVDGLLSGSSGGTTKPTSLNSAYLQSEYEVLSHAGTNPATGNDIYQGSDTVDPTGNGFEVARTWTVEPMPVGGETQFARLTVVASWTDRFGKTHGLTLESLVLRRN